MVQPLTPSLLIVRPIKINHFFVASLYKAPLGSEKSFEIKYSEYFYHELGLFLIKKSQYKMFKKYWPKWPSFLWESYLNSAPASMNN